MLIIESITSLEDQSRLLISLHCKVDRLNLFSVCVLAYYHCIERHIEVTAFYLSNDTAVFLNDRKLKFFLMSKSCTVIINYSIIFTILIV